MDVTNAKKMLCFNPRYAIFHLTRGSILVLSLASRHGFVRGVLSSPIENIASANDHSANESVAPFLDAQSINRHEESIMSSLREESKHRSLLTGSCMGVTGCTANDLEFLAVTGVTVNDPGAYVENGVWKGGCRGKDDYVNVSFTANLNVANTRYDVGLYINLDGGSADATGGSCTMSLLNEGAYANGTIVVSKLDADACPDVSGKGTLQNYAFSSLILKCSDTASSNGTKVSDGLLDFDTAISWDNNAQNNCSPNSTATWPKPGTTSKCWHGGTYPSRVTLPVYVPPYNSPSSEPSISPSLSAEPSSRPSASPNAAPSSNPSSMPSVSAAPSGHPSNRPSLSTQPSASPNAAPSTLPSSSPSTSSAPSVKPSSEPSSPPSSEPSSQPSDEPSSKPSSSPSSQPSRQPSDQPSSKPSALPSSQPSSKPSSSPSSQPSSQPSDEPSFKPSSSPSSQPSRQPSDHPSSAPSISAQPSSSPSNRPSVSSQPSVSAQPSTMTDYPSSVPSISTMPSRAPSDVPSRSPSERPSNVPSRSPSEKPSSKPSASPTDFPSRSPSESPTVSAEPTRGTPQPSSSPSISQFPSSLPSASPTISTMPSSAPSAAPSESPSASPTGSLYYPDWINDAQVCKNDGADPEYMMQVQKDNYLYHSKEECCQNHFWWRIQQCMGNEKPMYYSNGSFCDQKVFFEDWESKFTPGTWSSSDQFETLQQCCAAKFYWDIQGCVDASPKELTFTFTFTLDNIIEPTNCQDADTMGNALETAINIGLGSNSISTVTQIGCAALGRNPDTDNTVCGGCLQGSFIGNYDGTRPAGYYLSSASATVSVQVTTKSSDCSDSACFQSLYDSIISEFTAFVDSGDLSTEIVTWAQNRVPPIPELWNAQVDTSSFSTSGSYSDPFNDPNGVISAISITTTGELSVSGIPPSPTTAQKQELTSYFQTAIRDTLDSQGLLPGGAVVTVTGISGGVVNYEIIMSAGSQTDAMKAVSDVNAFLDESSSLALIATTVVNESSGGSVSLTSLSIDSNIAGDSTETTVYKATSTGKLATTIDSSSLTDIDSVKTLFEDSITQALQSQGVLPKGAFVTVTSILGGTVSYEITMYNDPSADGGSIVSSIDASLSQSSILDAISTLVMTNSAGLPDASTLATLDVTGFTAGATTGVPNNPWYPNFLDGKTTCSNDGFTPSFMNDSPDVYLFTSKKDCCNEWFSYNPHCTTAASTMKKFYPDLSTGLCAQKQEKDFESYEVDRYETLEECCSAKFSSYNYDACCSAPGLGGCEPTGVVVYLPNWTDSNCYAKSQSALATYEEVNAFSAAYDCCSSRFGWRLAACCKAAGGC